MSNGWISLNNPKVTFRSQNPSTSATSYDYTDLINACTLTPSRAVVSRNTFGTAGQRRNKKGRFDGDLTIDFDHDYTTSAAASRRFFAWLIDDYPIDVVIIANGAASASSANPSYSFAVAVDSLPLFDGDADSHPEASVTWPIHGEVTEATS